MGRFLERIRQGHFGVIVALPSNDLTMAQAAEAAGADAIKVHLNITHRASKVTFGSLEQERPVLERILSSVKIPVGIVPAAEGVRRDEVAAVARMGFDFIDMFAQFIPPWYLQLPGVTKVAAVDSTWTPEEMRMLARVPEIEMVEVAIIAPEGYGQPLSLRDLVRYRAAVQALDKPSILPTQRRVELDDVPVLAGLGINAVMIGVLFTGREADQLYERTKAFVRAARGLHAAVTPQGPRG